MSLPVCPGPARPPSWQSGTLARLSESDVAIWLMQREDHDHALQEEGAPAGICGVMNLEASVGGSAFTHAIARIHEAIAAGEC